MGIPKTRGYPNHCDSGQDGGHNRHNGVHSSIDLGDPEDVASIHSSYRLPSLASHLSNHQIAAITNGEYVELASLLPFPSLIRDRVNSNLKLQVGNEGLTIPLPSPAQRPKINSIDRWLDAFAIYSSVILSSYPSRGVDLFSYQQLIRESARKFPGMAWYVYDVEFRRCASHDLSKKWGERDVQLYLDTFTGLPKAIICTSCSISDHFTDSCPFPPGPRSPRGQTERNYATISTKGSLVLALPASTGTNAINLDALQPTQERTTMTCLPQDLSQSQLAALAILPEAAPDYLSKLSPSTPINIPKLSSYLCDHPDLVAVHTLLTGLSQGFKIGYQGPYIPKEYSNLLSAKDNPSIISKNILKEVQLGHNAGPFTSHPSPTCRFILLGPFQRNTPQTGVLLFTFHIPNTTPKVSY